MVSRIAFGAGYLGRPIAARARLLVEAYELGVNFWDASDDYGTHPQVARAVVFLCTACFSVQIERWSHDCFVMAEDEPWDSYDWYVIDAGDGLRLRALLGPCPARLHPECKCAVHDALRAAYRALPRSGWSGFAWAGRGDGSEVNRVSADVDFGLPKLVSRGGPSLRSGLP